MYTFKAHGLKGYCIVRLVIFFALKVNIYLQIMSIKRLDRFDQKRIFSLYFVCSFSPSIINYACPNFPISEQHPQWHCLHL